MRDLKNRPERKKGESAADASKRQVQAVRAELEQLQADLVRQLAAAQKDKETALERRTALT